MYTKSLTVAIGAMRDKWNYGFETFHIKKRRKLYTSSRVRHDGKTRDDTANRESERVIKSKQNGGGGGGYSTEYWFWKIEREWRGERSNNE